MSCKPTYKGVRYNSLEELYNANGVNDQQKQQVQQLYSQYLNTIFPDSKVKDIVYHGSTEKREFLDPTKQVRGRFGQGVSFAATPQLVEQLIDNAVIHAAIINLINPLTEVPQFKDDVDIAVKDGNYDGVQVGNLEYTVPTKEQIHILGSKQDIEGFKSWVGSNQSTFLTDDEIGVVKDTIIKRLLKDKENSEKSITFAEIDKSLGGKLSNALKGSSKTPEELWINFSSEGKVQLIDCL